jgi:aconitate hydratase 2/2-methylisocitrate dehydratase
VHLLKSMLAGGYQDSQQLNARISAMEAWLENPQLLTADTDAEYAAVIDIDLRTVTEPILACPNDPDDVRLLSDVAGTRIDDVFIGSCMTHADHFRAAARILDGSPHVPTRLWITPPTRMDADRLREEGLYAIFGKAGARVEIPGCSLCMGNQARVPDGATVVSTSTRNFPNRMGDDTRVFLGSAELAAVCAILGRIPSIAEYQDHIAISKG